MTLRISLSVLALLVVCGGCTTPPVAESQGRAEAAVESALGQAVSDIVAGAKGQRMQIFGPEGASLKALPPKQEGSVSVYTSDGKGQDNYTFDASGTVTRHLRSYGADYAKGVWKNVGRPSMD